jgi:hypothetical protein
LEARQQRRLHKGQRPRQLLSRRAFTPLVGDTVNQVFAIDAQAPFRAVAPLPARIGPKASRAVHV